MLLSTYVYKETKENNAYAINKMIQPIPSRV